MIYVVTDRKRTKDYLRLSPIGKIVLHKKTGWPVTEFKDEDIIFPFSIKKIPSGGRRIISAEGMRNTDNKTLCRKILQENGIPVPRTWFNINEAVIPYIARPPFHTFGNKFYVVRNSQQHNKVRNIKGDNWYYSKIFPTKEEFRVIIFDEKLMCSYTKYYNGTSPEDTVNKRNDIRRKAYRTGNIAAVGGKEVVLPDYMIDICIDATRATKTTFAGIDLLVDKDGNVAICEMNSAPTIPDEWVAGLLIKSVKEYIIKKGWT